MSTPLEEQLRRLYPPMRYTFNRYDYRKTPVRISSLFRSFKLHALQIGNGRVSFISEHLSSKTTIAVSEYPLSLSFGLALRIALGLSPLCNIEISIDERSEGVVLIVKASVPKNHEVADKAQHYHQLLLSVAKPAHFEAYFSNEHTAVSYTLVLPYYKEDIFEVYAPGFIISEVLRGLHDAATILTPFDPTIGGKAK